MAVRKASIVALGVFGSLMGAESQTHIGLMLLAVFLAVHIIFAPYDVASAKHRVLHHMDSAALAVCWSTLWAGLLFYRGDLGAAGSIFISGCILIVNTAFTLYGGFRLVKEMAAETTVLAKIARRDKRYSGDGSVPQNPMFTAKSAIEMVDIPAGWEEHHSEEHGRNYYVHTETGRSVWTMDEMQHS